LKKNKWKSLFFILAGLNIIVLAVIFTYLMSPAENSGVEKDNRVTNGSVPFKIETNKLDLNQVINHYLEEEGKGPIDYQINLDDHVNLFGTFPVFNQNIEMKVSFEPKVLENGDVILQQKSLSLGKLKLPASTVLKFVNDQYRFPEWVTIQPNDEMVYLDFNKLNLKSGLKVKVNKFDLKDDHITFTLFIPTS
jgi:uncharacterized protein YpmS